MSLTLLTSRELASNIATSIFVVGNNGDLPLLEYEEPIEVTATPLYAKPDMVVGAIAIFWEKSAAPA